MDTWAPGRGITTVEDLSDAILPWLDRAAGVTISGGEPFEQPQALAALVSRIRSSSVADILVFTGYPREAIEVELEKLHGLIDALITDPFDRNAPQTLALRGSDNQRLHLLTKLGVERFASFQRAAGAREGIVDLMFDEDGTVWLAGIPRRHDLRRLQRFLQSQGHYAEISEDKRAGTPAAEVRRK